MPTGACVFIGGKQIGANCLRALLEASIRPEFVVCNLDDAGTDLVWHESLARISKEAGLKTYQGVKVKDPDMIAKIKNVRPDIIFCIGGMQIIPKEVLEIPKLGCLNIHPALLPKFRGRFSTAHAIFEGEKESGATVHWMDEGIDTGPIIMQKAFPIGDDDTAKTVYDKFTETGTELFKSFLSVWQSDEPIRAVPQDESKASYYPKQLPNDGVLDWSWDGQKIRRFIRAMTFEPFPPPTFAIGDKKMIIIDENEIHHYAK